jgi:hypothetical protein
VSLEVGADRLHTADNFGVIKTSDWRIIESAAFCLPLRRLI